MKFNKLISLLLAVLMLASAFTMIVGAEELISEPKFSTNTGNGTSLLNKNPDSNAAKKEPYAYKTQVFNTPEEKLKKMDYRYGNDKYEIYVDGYSGEVAVKSKATQEILFTNPYNVATSKADKSFNSEMDRLLSQVIITYTDVILNRPGAPLNSYTWAAVRNQIKVRNIKNGIRVEYSIGREETRSLLPYMIEESDFQKMKDALTMNLETAIAEGKIAESDIANERHMLTKWESYYGTPITLGDYCDENGVPKTPSDLEAYETLVKKYDILKAKADAGDFTFTIRVLDEARLGDNVKKQLEGFIKEYYSEFTYDDLDAIHDKVIYEPVVETYPLFKLALEYTLDDNKGFLVTLPANGIRFDETRYRLDGIEVLPYIGAGMSPNTGYTFFPDGSGALFRFEDAELLKDNIEISGTIYGQDQAYHKISGKYEEVIRYPVFGVVEDKTYTKDILDDDGNVIDTEEYVKSRGFVAIVEEGEALMKLATRHQYKFNEYHSVVMTVNPRPKDSYNIADAISVGANQEWTVVSERRYTGNYRVRFMLLTDEDYCDEQTFKNEYDTSYVGMANAYRQYLIDNKMITELKASEVKNDIPLYIETFGALKTTEKFLSIPIDVMTPLTSFGDIKTMYNNLKINGVTNVNFIMTGYTDGGMTEATVPYGLKWESAVSKEIKFDELLEYANGQFGVFPDFDFVYAGNNTLFDGLVMDKHAAKTIDDRYANKREYSATKHTYVSYYEIALSPAYFDHFYEKFIPKYKKYNPLGISLSTLGSDLNSDFDEDEPYNREDSKKYTKDAFAYIDSELPNTQIMTSGGNAYSWKYVDHITDIALDSSRFAYASASVPFLGIVLHGYVQFSGEAINMEGNLDYALLKAIENGAALKFILSYRNTSELKEYETLSKYFSVNYEIWYDNGKGDLVTMYKELNENLKDLQTSVIVGHEFVDGVRIPDDDEIRNDVAMTVENAIAYEEALRYAQSDDERKAIFEARQLIIKANEAIKYAIDTELSAEIIALKEIFDGTNGDYAKALEDVEKALLEYRAYQQFHAIFSDLVDTTSYSVDTAIEAYNNYMADPTNEELKAEYEKWEDMIGKEYIEAAVEYKAAGKVVDEKKALLKEIALAEGATEEDVTVAMDAYTAYMADPTNEELKTAYEVAVAKIGEAYFNAALEVKAAEDECNAKKDVVFGMVAGVSMDDAQTFIDAMYALESYKQAWIEANAKGDSEAILAAKAVFDQKLDEIYGPILDRGMVYQFKLGDTEVGGSRYYRENEKREFTAATTALDEAITALYNATTEVIAKDAEVIALKYSVKQMKEAYALLERENAFTATERENLLGLITEVENMLKDEAVNNAMNEIFGFDIYGNALKANEAYKTLYSAVDAAGKEIKLGDLADYEISGLKASDYMKQSAFLVESKMVEEEKEIIVMEQIDTEKYNADAGMIVHETYEGGTEFLLNFNDYQVMVVINGVKYTVDAYGYKIINKPENA